jgi:hypothetical protein
VAARIAEQRAAWGRRKATFAAALASLTSGAPDADVAPAHASHPGTAGGDGFAPGCALALGI